MKEFKFKYDRKMMKKLFLGAVKGNIEVAIELNIIDNIYKINWINDRTSGRDNFKESLGVDEDQELINESLEYAKTLKQYKDIIKKYNVQ
jgi:hypothetical protein